MPRIAELKEIDGHVWARLEPDMNSPVYLYTNEEVRHIEHMARYSFFMEIKDLLNAQPSEAPK